MKILQNKPFYIVMSKNFFKKGDLVNTVYGTLKVIKSYKRTWIRIILDWLGYKKSIFGIKLIQPNEIKVISLEDN